MQVDFSNPAQVEQIVIDAKAEALKIEREPYTVPGGIQLGILNELIPLLEEYSEAITGRVSIEEDPTCGCGVNLISSIQRETGKCKDCIQKAQGNELIAG